MNQDLLEPGKQFRLGPAAKRRKPPLGIHQRILHQVGCANFGRSPWVTSDCPSAAGKAGRQQAASPNAYDRTKAGSLNPFLDLGLRFRGSGRSHYVLYSQNDTL